MGTPDARATVSSTAIRWLHDPRPSRRTWDTGRVSTTEYTGRTSREIHRCARRSAATCAAAPRFSKLPTPISRTAPRTRGCPRSRIPVAPVPPSA
ncbi:hypothetical protein SBRY_40231 [Actinacidiphila bryophytorum]|uniref:Uncharacterized protein n=1 Tax=Actinacidiphila bryophytorum TaxID=1436133 RepID=A0A9W4MB40_9ACTN|nr:hypothetical protein SBRY_40231 [Actinacidiphila bryophytorum]